MANEHADSPLLWVDLSRSFLNAAETIMRADPSATSTGRADLPTLYLLCHGLELALKAYLRAQGESSGRVRQFRHDLVAALGRCEELGMWSTVALSAEQKATLARVAPLHENHELRYPRDGWLAVPYVEDLASVVRTLLAQVEPLCIQATMRERANPTAGTDA